MRKFHVRIAFCSILCLGSTAAIAADSCTNEAQPDGSTYKVCVDDNGHSYCQSCTQGGVCSTVPCK